MANKANRPVKALLTAHEIVTALDEFGIAGVVQISEHIDRPQSVVHDYLSTLSQLGYVTNINGKYKLGLHHLELGGKVRKRIPLYKVAKTELRPLAEASDRESVTLCVEEDGRCVVLDAVQSSESIQYDWMPGTFFGMHCSGAGKAMLAYYPEERVEAIIDQHGLPARTENTVTDRKVLKNELNEVRESGVSFERGEYRAQMNTISAAIRDAGGTVVGALSISGPAHQMQESDVESALKNKLLSTVNIIEINYNSLQTK